MIDYKDRDILMISNMFISDKGTGSIRSFSFSKAFSNVFAHVHVITSTQDQSTFPNVSLYDVGVASFKDKARNDKIVTGENKTKWWYKGAIRLMKSFPTNLVFSEVNHVYVKKAISIAEEIIKRNEIKVIFSSFIPFGDHYIAYCLKKKYPDLKWIADYRDLYIEPLYQDVYLPYIQEYMERRLLKKADIVTTVSRGLVNHLRKYNRPTYEVMRGMQPRTSKSQYDKFTISYTGSLFQEFRDPRLLFSVLHSLIDEGQITSGDIDLIYAGKDADLFSKWIAENNLNSIYKERGLISRKEAKDIQDRSHINLLLTSSTSEWQGVLTGKVFEYIESGNATLCLIKGVKDEEFEQLFTDLNAGVVVYDPELNAGKMRAFLLEKYREWKSTGLLGQKVDFEKIKKQHSWNQRVSYMLEKLEES